VIEKSNKKSISCTPAVVAAAAAHTASQHHLIKTPFIG